MAPEDLRPRLLFLSPVYPYPRDRGQHVRISHLLRACAGDFRVTLLVPPPGPAGADPGLESLCERVVHVDETRHLAEGRAGWADFSRRHRVARRPDVARRLLAWSDAVAEVDLAAFRLVWVERLMLTAVVGAARGRTVVDLDDLEHRKWVRIARSPRPRPLRRRAVEGYYVARFLAGETLGARRFLACVVASPQDAAHLRRLGVRNVTVLPNGVDVGAAPPGGTRGAGPVRAVFVGNLAYDANVDALDMLSAEVLPALDARGLSVSVDVVGPGATPDLEQRHPRLHFRGFVEDVAAALRDHDLLLAPLRLGGGTKLKVLDALAAGLPVVTTPVGAEGLGVVSGVHAVVGGTAAELAAGVDTVARDPALAASLAVAGHALARDSFTWDSVRGRTAALLAALAAGRPLPGPAPRQPRVNDTSVDQTVNPSRR